MSPADRDASTIERQLASSTFNALRALSYASHSAALESAEFAGHPAARTLAAMVLAAAAGFCRPRRRRASSPSFNGGISNKVRCC